MVEAWLEATAGAAAWLRSRSGCTRVAALGIGLGGLLAWAATAGGAAIDDLVFWAVPGSGRTFLRELRVFAELEATSIRSAGGPEPPPSAAGVLAPGGFPVPPEAQEALAALDLAELPLPAGKARRFLLLDRDGIPPDPRLVAQVEAQGGAVDRAEGGGYGAMMVPPDLARTPTELAARVASWLSDPEHRRPASVVPASVPAAAPSAPARPGVVETPVRVPHGTGHLFGVLAEPGVPTQPLTAILLNAGAIRRIGPGGMWVAIARRWAANGVRSLRLDLDGIGDSSGDEALYNDVSELYVPRFVEQVRTTMDALDERAGPGRYLLLGLCSGAYWAFQTALEDERVAAAVMLNPRVLFWHTDLSAARDAHRLRRELLQLRAWRRMLTRESHMTLDRLVAALRWSGGKARTAVAQSERERVAQAFDRLAERGVRGAFLFCDGEPLRDELERDRMLPQPGRWPNLELVVLPGRDHTFRPPWMQEHVHAAVDRVLAEELDRVVSLPRTS